MSEQQPQLLGFSAGDLATINEDRLRRGLPPQLGHWLTADELREAGKKQEPVRVTLARIRSRLPIAGFPSLYFRVN